jgi:hypothetical protein
LYSSGPWSISANAPWLDGQSTRFFVAASDPNVWVTSVAMYVGGATLSGKVTLQNWIGVPQPGDLAVTLTIQLKQNNIVVRTQDVILDGSGNFSIGNVAPGTYDVVLINRWLSYQVNAVAVTESGGSIGTISFINGDANADNKVDVSDLGILAANYGMTIGAVWVKGDFNWDGKVDVSDLGILAANYGMGTGAALDFNADAGALGLVSGEEHSIAKDGGLVGSASGCGSMGLPLIAGLFLMGLFLGRPGE